MIFFRYIISLSCASLFEYTYENQVLDEVGDSPVGDNEESGNWSGNSFLSSVIGSGRIQRSVCRSVAGLGASASGYKL